MPIPHFLPQVSGLADYRPWFEQTEPWLPAMQEICRRHHLDPADLQRIPEGSAIVFAVGDMVIKLLPPFWRAELDQDLAGLQLVNNRLPVSTPELIATDSLLDWAYLITRRLPGQAAKGLWPKMSSADQGRICYQLGEVMAALHQIQPPYLIQGSPKTEWAEFVQAQQTGFVARQLSHGLAPESVEAFALALEQSAPAISLNSEGRLLHCDLTDEHLLLEEINGQWRLTGLLDFGDAMIGARAYEFAAPCALLTRHQPALRQTLIAGYGQSISEAQLLAAALLHRFCHLPGLIRQAGITPTPEAFWECYCSLSSGTPH
ncbi:MAG: hypothetical protein CVV27_18375 [Candidatus Melainabacteria bacterium HGW-Melainabacteria-1]|nr:MAG: hypothetical protein CVV27_18375 [Candidatus Melainabacteria bacterium HGW-Melainabacteria-1]